MPDIAADPQNVVTRGESGVNAKSLMVAGTMSSAGKSLISAGLCRIFRRRGLRVAPFKAQNMSNNAAVCADGGEIGRAQAIQAQAAGILPTVDMNPILMKPEADFRSQIIVQGQAIGTFRGRDYYRMRETLWGKVTDSLDRLRESADLVVIEGAGSIAELNLASNDIVNLRVARYAKAPIILVGDIDRGGIFAQLLGSWWLLDESDRRRIRAFVVNKFRGDPTLFSDGVRIIEERSLGTPILGVIPWMNRHRIPDEDAAAFSPGVVPNADAAKICVVHLPHISNFDDFDPLKYERGVNLMYAKEPDDLQNCRAILIPGTKNTPDDLKWLKQSGMETAVRSRHQAGTPVVGICGGYQIMGERVGDESGAEAGLGILPVQTEFADDKTTRQVERKIIAQAGIFAELSGETVSGYEIHHGITAHSEPLFSAITPTEEGDGCLAADGQSFGTYLHGLFANDRFRQAWLRSLGVAPENAQFRSQAEAAFDELADHIEKSIHLNRLEEIIDRGIDG